MAETEQKEFPTAAAATMTTGIVMGQWSDASALAEWLMGFPIWTHEYLELRDKIKAAVLHQFPAMPTTARSGAGHLEDLAAIEAVFGKTLMFRAGATKRRQSPIESLAKIIGDENVVVVEV